MDHQRLTLVLPAYNEAERIGPALDELFAYLDGLGRAPAGAAIDGAVGAPAAGAGVSAPAGAPIDGAVGAPAEAGIDAPTRIDGGQALPPTIDVLVVDDGSTDATADVVRARPESQADQGARLRVLQVPHGGKGAAVRAGMLAAEGDLVVFTDADMATPPDQLVPLVVALRDHDVALGSRIQPDGSDMRASQPGWRRLVGKVFHLFASVWVVGPVKDTQCGFKGFRRAAARDLFERQRITSIVFDVELIYLARRRGYRLAIVPIRWADRRGSRMRARPGLALRVAWDLFRIPLLHRGVRRAPAPAAGADGLSGD